MTGCSDVVLSRQTLFYAKGWLILAIEFSEVSFPERKEGGPVIVIIYLQYPLHELEREIKHGREAYPYEYGWTLLLSPSTPRLADIVVAANF